MLALLGATAASAAQTYFPPDASWKNVKTDFGAVGDGVTDDTAAFQRAFTTQSNQFNSKVAVFVPSGTYLVSDTLSGLQGFFDCCLTVQGENRQTTVIRLKDNLPAYQNVSAPKAVIYTRGGNQAFNMYFYNLTVSTGNGNPGAAGLDYISSNYGAIQDVEVRSEDGQGYAGVLMERQWPGPSLLKNVSVSGFQYGIRVGTCEYSMTFENITLEKQSAAGIYNACNTVSIRHLKSTNAVPAIRNESARTVLLDSTLEGGTLATSAVVNSGYSAIYLRNVSTCGYAGALSTDGAVVTEDYVKEYTNAKNYSLFPIEAVTESLGLPVQETPEYVNINPGDWVNVKSFGASPANLNFGFSDATAGIQAALNSGKPVVYLTDFGDNGTFFNVYADITIPKTVKMIISLNGAGFTFHNGSKFVVNERGAPLFFDRIFGARVLNNSSRTFVAKHSSIDYENTAANTNGRVFLEDVGGPFRPSFPVRMWARQLNPEVQSEAEKQLDNKGGKFWVLGLKTEGRATVARTTNGGFTEILGALVYPAASFSSESQKAFEVIDSNFSVTGLTMTSYVSNGWYGIAVEETKGGETRNLPASTVWQTTPYNFGFYRANAP